MSLQQALPADVVPSAAVAIHQFDASNTAIPTIGETIPPAATPILSQLGVTHLIKESISIKCPGSISIWGNQTGYGYHLDRTRFDQQLRTLVTKNNILFHQHHRLVKVRQKDRQYTLYFKQANDVQHIFTADYVVDASGKAAAFARRLKVARNVLDEVISLCVVADIGCQTVIGLHTLVEAVADGWWYAARIPNNKIIISFCSDIISIKENKLKNPTRWRQALQRTQLLKERIPIQSLPDNPIIHIRAAPSAILSKVMGRNWLAVGDAASSYDSISSAGITKALQNGMQAGTALAKLITGHVDSAVKQYENDVFKDFNQYARLRYDIYKSENRYRHKPFWIRRLGETISSDTPNISIFLAC